MRPSDRAARLLSALVAACWQLTSRTPFSGVSRSTVPLPATGGHPGKPDTSTEPRLETDVRLKDNQFVVIAADVDLVGRDDELVRLREFVSSMADGPRAMVVRGEAGIGKSTLWRAAINAEEVAAFTVLSARCVEAELPLALVGVSDLVQDALSGVADELADHERTALGVALGLERSDVRPPDAIALPRAFLSLLRLLARDAPVLIAIDDVQWLDGPSARVVSFAARRLGDAQVRILVTQRGDDSDPLGLAHAFDEEHLEEVLLGGLSIGALAHLLRRRLDTRIPRPVLSRVHRATGGNPMFALEFARQLAGRHGLQLGPLPFPA